MHKKVVITVLGWVLVAGGAAALLLPGPGLLLLLAGLVVLGTEYHWAQRWVEPVRRQAYEAAHYSVSAWWRIGLTIFGGAWLVGMGIVWWVSPTIPQIWVFGPELPGAGKGTAISLGVSGLLVWGLLGYSIWKFRHRR
jgi:Putative transmembrane protein (PGPGW)